MASRFLLSLFLALSVTFSAQAAPLRVVASFSVLADMAQEIGGDRVVVTTLVGPEGDAHVFQPTPTDAAAVSHADLVLVNGLGLEGWMTRLIEAAHYTGRVAIMTEGIRTLTMSDEDHPGRKDAVIADPHAWQDGRNGLIYLANIARQMSSADPAGAEYYRKRADNYADRLRQLDADLKTLFEALPADKRKVITTHDAFQYFGRAYGIEFLAPVGLSTDSEPSARAVARLIRQVRKEKIRALFIENISDPRLVEQIAKELGGVVGPPLYSDALSKADGPAPTYLDMLRYNGRSLASGMAKN